MAKGYTALHLGDFTDEDLKNAKDMSDRTKNMNEGFVFQSSYMLSMISVCEKRLSAGWFGVENSN